MPSTPNDPLQEATSLSLRNYLQFNVVDFPIESFHLLRLLIAERMNSYQQLPLPENPTTNLLVPMAASRLSPHLGAGPHLKLSDAAKFDGMLEKWADKWEHGTIVIAKGDVNLNGGQLMVIGAQVTDGGTASSGSRKRKRGEDGVQYSESVVSIIIVPPSDLPFNVRLRPLLLCVVYLSLFII
jgi:hypothetical protein